MTNNWNSRDGGLRRLRYAAFFLIGSLLVWVIVTEKGATHDIATIGTLVGALLVLLGFEAGVRWPGGKQ